MPRYYFTIRWVDHVDNDTCGTSLPGDAAAPDHACRMAREMHRGTRDSDAGLVIVKDEMHHTVLSIPFLAGFA